MSIQKRYWKAMVQVYFASAYVGLYFGQSVRRDRAINMFLAIVGCGSIAGWMVWTEYSYVWAVIVAISQVVNAVKGFLPYSKRIDGLSKQENELGALFEKMKHDWYKIAKGKYTGSEVNDLIYTSDCEARRIAKDSLTNDYLTPRKRFAKRADEMTESYFKENF